MRELLRKNPFLFLDARISASAGSADLGNPVLDIRLERSRTQPEQYSIIVIRVVESPGWDPSQRLLFESVEGSITLTEIGESSARLVGEVAGFYRRPFWPKPSIRRDGDDGDFQEAPVIRADLNLSLVLQSGPPDVAVPDVQGALSIESEGFTPDFGEATRIKAILSRGQVRLYPSRLPAKDASGRISSVLYLEILPLLVRPQGDVVFQDVDLQLRGAIDVWAKCGVDIIPNEVVQLPVSEGVITSLQRGDPSLLDRVLRNQVRVGGAVPVAFVRKHFLPGGGWTSDHGPDRAVVIVTDAHNETLLAHELGHVLGGKESNGRATSTYWVGEAGTIMDGTDDVAIPPPSEVGSVACKGVLGFARTRSVILP